MEDPLFPARKLVKAVDRICDELHIQRFTAGFIPAERGNPDLLIVTGIIDPKMIMSLEELEQLEFDASFEDLISNFTGPPVDPKQEKLEQIRKELEEDLNNGDLD